MNAICGFWQLDGAPARRSVLDAMLGAMPERAPDGTGAMCDGPLALGQCARITLPETEEVDQPLRHEETGCVITADARLDFREDLIERLGLGARGAALSDAGLILRAYLKWGSDCLARLEGDFAFALYDPRERQLLCARDRTGMRQVMIHHQPGRLFAFATEERALLRHPMIERRLNEGRIGDLLEDLEAIDLTQTFFEGIERLPPAHALILRSGEVRRWRYWQLERGESLRLGSDAEYAEAFLARFTRAVGTRLRSAGPVGCQLSGGMDSGSVAAISARLLRDAGAPPLHTFSVVADSDTCIETRMIGLTTALDHIVADRITPGEFAAMWPEIDAVADAQCNPFDSEMAVTRAVYARAKAAGVRVVLDGAAGDIVLTAADMVLWHVQRGHYRQAWREAKGGVAFWGEGASPEPRRALLMALRSSLVPHRVRRLRQAFWRRGKLRGPVVSVISPEFARQIGMDARRAADAAHVAGFGEAAAHDRAAAMLHPYIIVARERYDRVAAEYGVEPRDPFLDQRLLEFCNRLPADQFQRNGWPKFILRRALCGHLPDEVIWRAGKADIGTSFISPLFATRVADLAGKDLAVLRRYIDNQVLEKHTLPQSTKTDLADFARIGYLHSWLRRLDAF